MKILLLATEAELSKMNVDSELLASLVLEHVDSLVVKEHKIFWQVELTAEVEVIKVKK